MSVPLWVVTLATALTVFPIVAAFIGSTLLLGLWVLIVYAIPIYIITESILPAV